MFIDKSHTVKGKKYTRALLRTSYRDENRKVQHKTLANLSDCTVDEINAISLALKHKDELYKLIEHLPGIHITQGKSIGLLFVLHVLAERLGILKVFGNSLTARLCLWMIYSRAMLQCSKLASAHRADQFHVKEVLGLDKFDEDDLYEAMDWLAGASASIEYRLFLNNRKRASSKRIYLYDVTSTYFEGKKNQLAAYGYNRDGKKGKLQIVIGLLTDEQGDPIAVRVFEGNTVDHKTVEKQISLLAKRFGLKEIVFVGDRGMIKSAQIEELTANGFHYITAITKPQIRSLLKEMVIQLELFTEQLHEVTYEGVRYILKKNPYRAIEVQHNRQERIQKLKSLLVHQNEYLTQHPKANPAAALKNINFFASKLKLHKIYQGAIAPENPRAILLKENKEMLEQEALLDGCYVLKTDLNEKQADKQKVHARYKDLSKIEYAFKRIKTITLEVRPVYHRKENRTRAHVFITMMAYKLIRHIENSWQDLDMVLNEGLDNLMNIKSVLLNINNTLIQRIPEPEEKSKQLLKKLKINLPEIVPPYKL